MTHFDSPIVLAGLSLLVVGLVAMAWYVGALRRTSSVATGERLDLAMPPAWVLDLAAAQFSCEDWERVEGDGSINCRRVGLAMPSVSVEAVPGDEGGSEVHIWMSGWTVRAGLVSNAGVARRQMRTLVQVLLSADRSYAAPVPQYSPAEVLDILAAHESRQSSAA